MRMSTTKASSEPQSQCHSMLLQSRSMVATSWWGECRVFLWNLTLVQSIWCGCGWRDSSSGWDPVLLFWRSSVPFLVQVLSTNLQGSSQAPVMEFPGMGQPPVSTENTCFPAYTSTGTGTREHNFKNKYFKIVYYRSRGKISGPLKNNFRSYIFFSNKIDF